MASYEQDHNINSRDISSSSDDHHRQFHSLSEMIDLFMTRDSNTESVPTIHIMEQALARLVEENGSSLVNNLISRMGEDGETSQERSGVDDSYLETLERVPLVNLTGEDNSVCPICTNKFADNEYPLLVKLPCHVQNMNKKTKAHIFDLECIGPWLKVNSTCPICRFNIKDAEKIRRQKIEEEIKLAEDEYDEEDEDDRDLYG